MRKSLICALVLVPALAFARSGVRASFGGRPGGGRGRGGAVRGGAVRGRRGGLTVGYNRHTSHSHLSIGFRGGSRLGSHGGYTRRYGTYSSGVYGYGLGGVYVQRGWIPYSPSLYGRVRPWTSTGAVGPFTYVDSVHFAGTGGVAVLGRGGETGRARPVGTTVRSAWNFVNEGDEHFGLGDFRKAVDRYREAVKAAPDDPMPAFALGHGLFAAGQYAESAKELRRALRLFPDMVKVRMNRRDFYRDRRVFDAQFHRLALHVGAKPGDKAARFLFAYHLFFTQQHSLAKEHFERLGGEDSEAQLFLREIARLKP